jgi:hypothetical protein
VAAVVVVVVILVAVLLPGEPCDDLLLGSGGVDPNGLVAQWERESDCEIRTAESGGGFSSQMSIYELCENPDTGEIERNALEMLVWEDFDPVWRRVGARAELRERQENCAQATTP